MIEKNISTTSDIVQDISNELIFGHTHNGVKCAACPTAKRACDRAWVTAKQIENWSKMPKMTLWRWLEKLEKARRIATVSDLTQWRSSNPKMLLPLLKRKELDSKTFANDEIILGNFKGKESLPLANRGNTFVSLRGVLEILSKTELSSDIVQTEVRSH